MTKAWKRNEQLPIGRREEPNPYHLYFRCCDCGYVFCGLGRVCGAKYGTWQNKSRFDCFGGC